MACPGIKGTFTDGWSMHQVMGFALLGIFFLSATAFADDRNKNVQAAAPSRTTTEITIHVPDPISVYQGFPMYKDARMAADAWTEMHQDGIAVSVILGPAHVELTPERIQEVLTADFSEEGFTNIAFFFEKNDVGGHVGDFHLKGNSYGDGPWGMGEFRSKVPLAVEQLIFENTELKLLLGH